MVPYLGDFIEDDVVFMVFNTFDSNDPSASVTITNFLNSDVHIHKDDGLTQRNNTAGITVSKDFDGITGSHMIKIDTNDNTVVGFWVAGADYFVRVEGTTVDAAAINAFVGHFSIENRSALRPAVAGRTLAVDANNRIDVGSVLGTAQTAGDIMASLGEENAGAAAGDPSTTESVIQYVKQLINILIGTAGVVTFPAEAAPANAVSLAEVIRAIHADVTGLAGAAMRGTDSANTTTPPTVGAIADQVWEEAQADHVAAGSFGLTASEIADIKTKTDSLTFTKANEVDANTQSINGAEVVGDGNVTPWDGI